MLGPNSQPPSTLFAYFERQTLGMFRFNLNIYNTKQLDIPIEITQTELGRGRFSNVYLGVYKGEKVAVKRLQATVTEEQMHGLMKEVQALRKLSHANIVKVLRYMIYNSIVHSL